MVTEHNPAGSRKRLGEVLRSHRNRRGLTLEELGAMVGVDRTQLGRIERGRWRPDVGQVMNILDQLGVEEPEYDKIILIARGAADKGWWKAFRGPAYERQRTLAELESGTARIREFGTTFVPGLLQTEDYSAVRFSDFPLFAQPAAVERAVQARLARQSALFDDPAFSYEVVLDEAVLLRRSCPAETMRKQLEYVAEIGKSRPNATIRVLPLASPVHERVSWSTGFSLMSYQDPEEPDVVFVETLTYDPVLDDREDVDWYASIYSQLCDASLSPAESVRLLRAAASHIER